MGVTDGNLMVYGLQEGHCQWFWWCMGCRKGTPDGPDGTWVLAWAVLLRSDSTGVPSAAVGECIVVFDDFVLAVSGWLALL